MHEMSLAEGVMQIVEASAGREQARRVRLVVLEIGCLSSVEPQALRFCFEAVSAGTIAQGAVLEIISVPGTGKCMLCSETVPMDELFGTCPECGGHQLQATGGTEMRVKEIEIE
jgi:hydrogenase nickel incorporation protein HypA/HybF